MATRVILMSVACATLLACASEDAAEKDVTECEVVAPERCSEGCMPVISAPRWAAMQGIGCVKSGVFLGCVPDVESSIWDAEGTNGMWSACVSLPAPDPYWYCLVSRYDLSWYWNHTSLFCGHTGGPDCSGPEPEYPPACYEDVPDDNISPFVVYGEGSAPMPPNHTACLQAHPMPPECYTE